MMNFKCKNIAGCVLSLAMAMATLPAAYVNAESTTVSIAAGKNVDVYTAGEKTGTYTTWTDGLLSNGGDDAVKLPVDAEGAPVYGVMDLGAAARIDSLRIRSSGTYQHTYGLEIWGTNDISGIANDDITAFATKLAVVENNGTTVDNWYLQYDMAVADANQYRYIIFRNPTFDERSVGTDYWASAKWVHEVYVNAVAELMEVAAGKNVDVYTSGKKTGTYTTWTDGLLSNGGDDAVKLPVDAQGAPVYGVMDLGTAAMIDSLRVRSSGTYQHTYGLEIWGTNDISGIANDDITAFATKLAVVENNGTTVDNWYLQYDMAVADANQYRYIIFRNPTFDERSVGTDYWASAKWVHEVYVNAAVVYKVEEEEPVITIEEVNMGSYAGKAWDIVINDFDGAKTYTATFTDNNEVKSGEIGFDNVEADDGSIAFAIFLHTSRTGAVLDIIGE